MALKKESILNSYVPHMDIVELSKWVCRIERPINPDKIGLGTGFFCIRVKDQYKFSYFATARHNFYPDPNNELLKIKPNDSEWSAMQQKILQTISELLGITEVYINKQIIKYGIETDRDNQPFERVNLKNIIDSEKPNNIIFKVNSDFVLFILKNEFIFNTVNKIEFINSPLELNKKFTSMDGPALIIQYPGKDVDNIWFDDLALGFDVCNIEHINETGGPLLCHNGNTLPGSSGSPIIQFVLNKEAKNKVDCYVVGVHKGEKTYVQIKMDEGVSNKISKFNAVDLIYEINIEDSWNKIDKEGTFKEMIMEDTSTFNFGNSVLVTATDELLNKGKDEKLCPIFPYKLYEKAYKSFVKIIIKKYDKKEEIGTGVIINFKNEIYLGVPKDIKMENAILVFEEKFEVPFEELKSNQKSIELFNNDSIKLMPISVEGLKKYDIITRGVNVRTSAPYKINAILIGTINEAVAIQQIMIESIIEIEYSDILSAIKWKLELEQKYFNWPCSSFSVLFQLREIKNSEPMLELVGFGIKHDPREETKIFGFGACIKKKLDPIKRQSICKNLSNYFYKIIVGNNEYKGICCKLKYIDIYVYGIILPYINNIYGENGEMFQLEVLTSRIDLGQQPSIIFNCDYNFCFIILENFPSNINFLEIEKLSEVFCQNHLLYFISKGNDPEIHEVNEIKNVQVASRNRICCIEELQETFKDILPFVFNENENLVGLLIPPLMHQHEMTNLKIHEYDCGFIENIIEKITSDKILVLDYCVQKMAKLKTSNENTVPLPLNNN